MIYHFANDGTEESLWELAGRMPQSKAKKCDPNKTMQESTFEGIRAEYAFLDMNGLKFDWRLKEGGDHGLDFSVSGRWCQMKYNNWRPPRGALYFRDSQPWVPRVQIAILAVPTVDLVNEDGKANSLGGIEFYGWTGKIRFQQFSYRTVWPGKCATPITAMNADDLKRMDDLLSFLFPLRNADPKDLKQKTFFP